jgi:hypothetical protein
MVFVPGTLPGPIPGLDCSDAAQDVRRQQLADLRAKIASGVQAVGDRGRSVTYRNLQDLERAAQRLQQELDSCILGRWVGRKRLAYVDLVKGL